MYSQLFKFKYFYLNTLYLCFLFFTQTFDNTANSVLVFWLFCSVWADTGTPFMVIVFTGAVIVQVGSVFMNKVYL